MIAADTNVLVRLLVSDDLKQQRSAKRRIKKALDSGESVLVTDVSLAELSWVLSSAYDYGREDIADAIEAVVSTPPFLVTSIEAVLAASRRYRDGGAEFSDFLLVERAKAAGATPVITFDKTLSNEPECEKP